MIRPRLTARAYRDLQEILAFSFENYGRPASDRYGALLRLAMEDVANQPLLLGSRPIRGHAGYRIYPVASSRRRVAGVRRAVHRLIYSATPDGEVTIFAIVGTTYPLGRAIETTTPT